jgi:hypothetical protein
VATDPIVNGIKTIGTTVITRDTSVYKTRKSNRNSGAAKTGRIMRTASDNIYHAHQFGIPLFSLCERATSSQCVPFEVEGGIPKKPVEILLPDGSAVDGIDQDLGLLIVRFEIDAQDGFPLSNSISAVSVLCTVSFLEGK